MDITPLDLRVKQYIREYFAMRRAEEKRVNPATIGFTIRDIESEKEIDEMWLFINKRKKEDDAAGRK